MLHLFSLTGLLIIGTVFLNCKVFKVRLPEWHAHIVTFGQPSFARTQLSSCVCRYQELQRVKELKETETHGALKMSNFELDRLKAVLDETKNALEHTRLENEALHAKAKV